MTSSGIAAYSDTLTLHLGQGARAGEHGGGHQRPGGGGGGHGRGGDQAAARAEEEEEQAQEGGADYREIPAYNHLSHGLTANFS